MDRRRISLVVLPSVVLVLAGLHPVAAQSPAHVHMGHVAESFAGTPDQAGLLSTAQDEAGVAETHANLSTSQPDDLASIQRHIGHVVNAVDPTVVENGPGKGYGLIKASEGVARHIELAAASEGASGNVTTHATHVATSAANTVTWGREILELAEGVNAATSASDAAKLAEEIQALCAAIVGGTDANEDGRIGWEEGEGGLEQASFHMDLMKTGEGM